VVVGKWRDDPDCHHRKTYPENFHPTIQDNFIMHSANHSPDSLSTPSFLTVGWSQSLGTAMTGDVF